MPDGEAPQARTPHAIGPPVQGVPGSSLMAGPSKLRSKRRNEARAKRNRQARQQATARQAERPERARYVTQLELLLNRASISRGQYKAGDRLYRTWRASGSEPAMVAGYERGIPGRGDMTEAQALARSEVTFCLRFVGPIGSDVLVHICLIDNSLPTWERVAGRKIGDGAAVLRAALDRLADAQDEWRNQQSQKAKLECSLTPERDFV